MSESGEETQPSALERKPSRENSATDSHPPLPEEPIPSGEAPPLPAEPVPEDGGYHAAHDKVTESTESAPAELADEDDDGWRPYYHEGHGAWLFWNYKTGVQQWENPRVPEATGHVPAHPPNSTASAEPITQTPTIKPAAAGGYNPAIHGDYDPNADYAKDDQIGKLPTTNTTQPNPGAIPDYSSTGVFNRVTGKWQGAKYSSQNHTDEAKSNRQMGAYFDVDAAANEHDGRSLKAERRQRQYTKEEIDDFKEKRRAKKERKRREWLMN